MKSINEAMIQDHEIINKLLNSFKEKLNSSYDYKELLKSFFSFKWNLEKHFFIEEKIIINEYAAKIKNPQDSEINHILKEHKEMLEILNEIQDTLDTGEKPSLDELTDLLNAHEKNEDHYFYPKLDEELDVENKKLILERCKEIILG